MFVVCDDGYDVGIADVCNSRRQWRLVNMTGDCSWCAHSQLMLAVNVCVTQLLVAAQCQIYKNILQLHYNFPMITQ